MAEAITSLSEEQFSCSVCLEIFKDPVTLPCGHSYCMECIDYHWKQPEQRGAISCPQCRHNFSPKPVLRKNFVLADVVERLKQRGLSPSLSAHSLTGTGHVPCDFCTGRKLGAVRSCLTCSASYCPEHLKPHFTVLSFKRHQLVEATGDLIQTLCQQHHRPLEVFCRTDWSFVCLLCAATKHRRHCTVTPEDERASTQAVELHSCVWWKEGVQLAKQAYDTLKAWIPKREASASQLRYIAQQLERMRREANYSRKVRGLAAVGAFVSAVCTAGLGAPLLGAVAGGVAVTTAMTAIWGVAQRVESFKTSDCMKTARKITETDKEAAKKVVRLMKELDKMAERIAASQRCVDSPELLGKEHVFTRLVSAGLFAGTTLLTARNVNKMAFLMGKLAKNMRAISGPGETAACGPRLVFSVVGLGFDITVLVSAALEQAAKQGNEAAHMLRQAADQSEESLKELKNTLGEIE
ncbi:E3 ubiquitin-protein ligase TRIM56-like isoform X2 [Acipenser ruthenus]|nr:E3 ubiquitin-protein ligase TRIM56-like isoform X2 [Acipenser ruthenus]XP_058874414.1 E3 ubiquitin-protein ligase TRIM56-like isoform X2 [Acipenser ruthenus]